MLIENKNNLMKINIYKMNALIPSFGWPLKYRQISIHLSQLHTCIFSLLNEISNKITIRYLKKKKMFISIFLIFLSSIENIHRKIV